MTRVNSGDKAVDLLQQTAFDLVITDLVMERVDGIQVLKKTKEIDATIMVIVLTGFGDMLSAIEALRSQADDYMLKPCESSEMFFRVERCLEKLELARKIDLYQKILPMCCVCKKIRDDTGKVPGRGKWTRGAVHPRQGPAGHHLQLLPGVRAPDPPGVHQTPDVTLTPSAAPFDAPRVHNRSIPSFTHV